MSGLGDLEFPRNSVMVILFLLALASVAPQIVVVLILVFMVLKFWESRQSGIGIG